MMRVPLVSVIQERNDLRGGVANQMSRMPMVRRAIPIRKRTRVNTIMEIPFETELKFCEEKNKYN